MRLLLILLFVLPMCLTAQKNQVYQYEYKLYMVNKVPSESADREAIDFIGMERMDTVYYDFLTDNHRGEFSARPRLSNHQGGGLDFGEILITTYGSYFYDLTDSIMYHNMEIGNRKFSIKKDFNTNDWELSDDLEVINGFQCRKAIHTVIEEEREIKTTVWYTDEIDSKVMPFGMTGLSGGIVKINFHNFSEVLLGEYGLAKRQKNLKPFKLNKVISQEEFDRLQAEHSQRMRELRGGNVDKD